MADEQFPAARARTWASQFLAVGLPPPVDVQAGKNGGSAAAAFTINGITETIEGCGQTESELVDDVMRQLRHRLGLR